MVGCATAATVSYVNLVVLVSGGVEGIKLSFVAFGPPRDRPVAGRWLRHLQFEVYVAGSRNFHHPLLHRFFSRLASRLLSSVASEPAAGPFYDRSRVAGPSVKAGRRCVIVAKPTRRVLVERPKKRVIDHLISCRLLEQKKPLSGALGDFEGCCCAGYFESSTSCPDEPQGDTSTPATAAQQRRRSNRSFLMSRPFGLVFSGSTGKPQVPLIVVSAGGVGDHN